MTLGQTLTGITTKVLLELEPILHQENRQLCLFMVTQQRHMPQQPQLYAQIPIGHVEAGLRTWNKRSPYPEEANRQLIDVLADLYFAPTLQSKENLLRKIMIQKPSLSLAIPRLMPCATLFLKTISILH